MIRRVIGSVLLLGCVQVAVHAQNPQVLSLEDAVRITLAQNRLVKHEQLDVDKAGDRVAAARTRLYPQFDVSVLGLQLLTDLDFRFPKGSFGLLPQIGPVPPTDTTLTTGRKPVAFVLATAAQPLSQIPRIRLGIQLQETTQELARNALQSQQLSLVNQVKKGYYGVLRQQSALVALEESLKLYRELERVVTQYVSEQVALDADRLDVKARLAKEEYEVLSLRNSLQSQKEQLNLLMGRDLQSEFAVSSIAESSLYDVNVDTARSRALQQRPELQEARLKAKQADYDVRMKKSEAVPEVNLYFGFIGAYNVAVLPQNTAAVGVQLRWNIFDWGRGKLELAEKRKTLAQAENAVPEVQNQILLEVNLRFRKLGETRALLHVTELKQEATRERLRVATNRFTVESVLLKDVLLAQTAVAESNHEYQQALLAFWAARADLEKAVGEN